MSKNERYGLTNTHLQNAKDKLQKQKDFLESQSFLKNDKTGEMGSLLDYSYSANLSKRYYPRILNKVNTFVSLNESRYYLPVFLTITLDGFFRDFMKADYSRFSGDLKDKYIKGDFIPNNDRMGYYLDHIDQCKAFTPRDMYKVLGYQLRKFIGSHALQKIRKDGFDYSMIRVTEPHKDGVPHFHILLYIPQQYLKVVFLEFKKRFPAPQNHKKINIKEDKRNAVLMFDNEYETKGFQTEIRSPSGYLLKYILKSFRNLINDDDLDYLQAWYVHNKIPRIITTHTLISQSIYHHASLLDDDWYYLTMIKRDGIIKKDNILNTFHLYATDKRELIYENGFYQLLNDGRIIKEFGENKLFRYRFTIERPYTLNLKDLPYVDCIFHKINFIHWRFVPRRKKYFYKIFSENRYFEFGNDMSLYFDKTSGEILNIEDIDIDSSLDFDVLKSSKISYDKDFYKYGKDYRFEPTVLRKILEMKTKPYSQNNHIIIGASNFSNDYLFNNYMMPVFDSYSPRGEDFGTNREFRYRLELVRRKILSDLSKYKKDFIEILNEKD